MSSKVSMGRTVLRVCVLVVLLASFWLVPKLWRSFQEHSEPTWWKEAKSAEQVLAYRTRGLTEKSDPPRYEAYYEKDGDPVELDKEGADRIKALLEKAVFDKGPMAACIATPGFVLTFISPGKNCDVFLCFECGLIVAQPTRQSVIKRDEVRSYTISMLPIGSDLWNELKSIFPDAFRTEGTSETAGLGLGL
ncbi:MAG: hypothetical protein ACK4UN_05405 [Limisphaerales bacterium]